MPDACPFPKSCCALPANLRNALPECAPFQNDHETGTTVRIPDKGEAAPVEVPYKYIASEADLFYLLGGCTGRFDGLLDPRNRNA